MDSLINKHTEYSNMELRHIIDNYGYDVDKCKSRIVKSRQLSFYFEHNWQSAFLRDAIFLNPISSFPVSCIKEYNNSIFIISSNVLKKYFLKL